MIELADITIICEDIEKVREIYYSKIFENFKVINDTQNYEVDYFCNLPTLSIGNTHVMKVHPNISKNKFLRRLKSKKVDAVVVDGVSVPSDRYLVFLSLDALMDYVIEKDEEFTFAKDSIEDDNVEKLVEQRRMELFNKTKEPRYLPESLKTIFMVF